MRDPDSIRRVLELRASRNSKIHSKEQMLADEVWKLCGYPYRGFPLIMKLIKLKGYRFIYECLAELKDARGVKNYWTLFLYKAGKEKVVYPTESKGLDLASKPGV